MAYGRQGYEAKIEQVTRNGEIAVYRIEALERIGYVKGYPRNQ
jgi:hypothetical protein